MLLHSAADVYSKKRSFGFVIPDIEGCHFIFLIEQNVPHVPECPQTLFTYIFWGFFWGGGSSSYEECTAETQQARATISLCDSITTVIASRRVEQSKSLTATVSMGTVCVCVCVGILVMIAGGVYINNVF